MRFAGAKVAISFDSAKYFFKFILPTRKKSRTFALTTLQLIQE